MCKSRVGWMCALPACINKSLQNPCLLTITLHSIQARHLKEAVSRVHQAPFLPPLPAGPHCPRTFSNGLQGKAKKSVPWQAGFAAPVHQT